MTIISKFKYTIDLGIKATKSTFKLKKSKKDTTIHILVMLFICIFAGILAWDIVNGKKFILDMIILTSLIIIEIFNWLMPHIIIGIQKKFLLKLNLESIEYTTTEINKKKCIETFYKEGKVVLQNVTDISKIVSYQIDGQYIFVVFNNYVCAIFDKNTLSITLDEFIKHLNLIISQNQKSKK